MTEKTQQLQDRLAKLSPAARRELGKRLARRKRDLAALEHQDQAEGPTVAWDVTADQPREAQSRSQLRRVALQKGEERPTFGPGDLVRARLDFAKEQILDEAEEYGSPEAVAQLKKELEEAGEKILADPGVMVGTANCHEASCCSSDTLVETNRGLLKIGDLADHTEEYRETEGLLAVTDEGLRAVPETYHYGETETLKIETRRSFTFEGTPNHKLKREDGTWVRLDELVEGDILRVQLGTIWPDVDPRVSRTRVHNSSKRFENPVEIPEFLTEDWAELLGWWAAEGSYNESAATRQIQFTVNGVEKPYVEDLLRKLGLPWVPCLDKRKKGETWNLQVNSIRLTHWFRHDLKLLGGARTKHVPWPVLQGTLPIVRAFLGGVSGGDGHAKAEACIVNSTSSPTLAHQIHELWRRVGVVAGHNQYPDKRDPRVLYQKGRDEILAGVALLEGRDLATSHQVQTSKRWMPLILSWIKLPPHKREKLERVAVDIPFPETLHHLVGGPGSKCRMLSWNAEAARNGGICGTLLERVDKIEESRAVVKDLVVPSNHTYIANGFVSHNTQGRWRERSVKRIMDATEEAVRLQGAEKVSFYSLTWCSVGTSRVLTDKGYQQIKDLDPEGGTLLTEFGPKSYATLAYNGRKKTLKVRLNSGTVHAVTSGHRFKILDSEGHLEWAVAGELEVGDKVLSQRGHRGLLPENRGGDPEFWYAIGHLWGDGAIKFNGFRSYYPEWISPEGEEESMLRIENFLTAHGLRVGRTWEAARGVDARGFKHQGGMHHMVTDSQEILDSLHPYEPEGMWRQHGFPEAYWKLGEKQLGAFLNGLFTTDGAHSDKKVGVGQISFATKHRKLAEDVRRALLLLGVVAHVYRSERDTPFGHSIEYSVYATGTKSRKHFTANVGYSLSRKTALLGRKAKIASGDQVYGYHKVTSLINEIFPQRGLSIRKLDPTFPRKADSVSTRIALMRRGASQFLPDSTLGLVLERARLTGIPGRALDALRDFHENDWFFDEVLSVEDGEEEDVYDVVNSETASYVLEGSVVHNSLHSDVYSLLLETYKRFGDTNLISQRADQASADPDFFQFQSRNGEHNATIGVEGISQRMRNYLNKCTAVHYRVLTDAGYTRVGDLSQGGGTILTEYGPRRYSGWESQGVRPVLRLKTRSGGEVDFTGNHPMRVCGPQGRLEWKLAEDLVVGDYLLGRRGDAGLLPEDRGGDPEWWYAAGWVWGDGTSNLAPGSLVWTFSEGKQEAQDRIQHHLRGRGNSANASLHTVPGPDSRGFERKESGWKISAGVGILKDETFPPYEPEGMWRQHGFPESYWKLGRSQQRMLLQALFDTDGGMSAAQSKTKAGKDPSGKGRILFATKHRKLAEDVRRMLILHGVVSTIITQELDTPFGHAISYHVTPLGTKSHANFVTNIGFGLTRKAAEQQRLVQRLKSAPKDMVFGYPNLQDQFASACPPGAPVGPRGDTVSTKIREYRAGISPVVRDSILDKVLERLETFVPAHELTVLLKEYEENEWYFDEVVAIEDGGEVEVIDVLGVETEHEDPDFPGGSFVCEGLVVHNSLSEDQFIRAMENAAKAGYTSLKHFMILSLVDTSMVWTGEGAIPVRELWEQATPAGPGGHDVRVEGPEGWFESRLSPGLSVQTDRGVAAAPVVVRKHRQAFRKMRTWQGFEVTGTPGHRVRTLDLRDPLKPGYAWKALQDLVPGDKVAVYDGKGLFPGEDPIIEGTEFCLTSDLARYLGYWVGNGSILNASAASATLGVDTNRKVPGDGDYAKHLISVLGWTWSEVFFNGHPSYMVSGPHMNALAVGLSLCNGAENKRVPECIFRATEETTWAFLQGLFAADGTVDPQKTGRFNTVSEELSVGVQQLLLRLGVVTTRKFYENTPFGAGTTAESRKADPNHGEAKDIGHVLVLAWDAGRFKEGMRGTLPRKWDKLRGDDNDKAPYGGLHEALKAARLPATVSIGTGNRWGQTLTRQSDKVSAVLKNYQNFASGSTALHRQELEVLRSHGVDLIPDCPWEGVYFDEVESVVDGGEGEVYCLMVPEGVTYVADGMVHHNTGLETEEDVEEYCDLLRRMHSKFEEIAKELTEKNGKTQSPLRINPSFMMLINLAHTPLQWAPCAAAFNLRGTVLDPIVDITKELGFGFRLSLTRDRIRWTQWTSIVGREGTEIIAEVGLRSNFQYFGPVGKLTTLLLERQLEAKGYSWMQYFREKSWGTVFPWDAVATPFRRDYLWNQWKLFRHFVGASYCLRTSVNNNPRCHDCLIPGTMITLFDGTVKPVEEIEVGDRVLTHTGSVSVVTAVMSREVEEDLYEIDHPNSFAPLVVTGNHPIFAATGGVQFRPKTRSRRSDLTGADFSWVDASALSPGDALFIPTPAFDEVPRTREWTEELVALLGWYAAEGCEVREKGERVGFQCILDNAELEYQGEVMDLMTYLSGVVGAGRVPYNNANNQHSRRVGIRDRYLADLCAEHVGLGKHHKRLSPELYSVLMADEDLARAFLHTFCLGDGHQRDTRVNTQVTASTVARQMMEQLFWVLVRHGLYAVRDPLDTPGGPEDRSVVSHQFRWRLGKQQAYKWWKSLPRASKVQNGPTWPIAASMASEVTEIRRVPYRGVVYNFSVEGDESYLAEGVAVHNCGACGDASDRKFMLTRELETADSLEGKEAWRRDMTQRKRVRWDLEVTEPLLRVVPKEILARHLARAFMLAAFEAGGRDHVVIQSYLGVVGHSLRYAEGKGNQPWVMGHVLVDMAFNENWADEQMRSLLPRINEHLWGLRVHGFVAGDRLEPFDAEAYALYQIDLPISMGELKQGLELYQEQELITYKQRVTVSKDATRLLEVEKERRGTIPGAAFRVVKVGEQVMTRFWFLCSLPVNPVQLLTVVTKKRGSLLKPYPILSLGVYRYDRGRLDEGKVGEDDIFAALEDRQFYCVVSPSDPIETDLFTGDLYRSKTGRNLCLFSDLKGAIALRERGINVRVHGLDLG